MYMTIDYLSKINKNVTIVSTEQTFSFQSRVSTFPPFRFKHTKTTQSITLNIENEL